METSSRKQLIEAILSKDPDQVRQSLGIRPKLRHFFTTLDNGVEMKYNDDTPEATLKAGGILWDQDTLIPYTVIDSQTGVLKSESGSCFRPKNNELVWIQLMSEEESNQTKIKKLEKIATKKEIRKANREEIASDETVFVKGDLVDTTVLKGMIRAVRGGNHKPQGPSKQVRNKM